MVVQCTCLVVSMSPCCIFCEVTWPYHVSEIYGLFFVNDVQNFVLVLMICMYRKFGDSHMAGCICMLLFTSAYGCLFFHSVVQDCRQSRVT